MGSSNRFTQWTLSLLLGAAAMGSCRADTIFLTDGREINGTIVSEDQQTVVIKTVRGTTRSIRRAEIDTITRERPKLAVVEKKEDARTPITGPSAVAEPVVGVRPAARAESVKTAVPVNPGAPDISIVTPGGNSPANAAAKMTRSAAAVGASPPNTRPAGMNQDSPVTGFPEHEKRMSKRKETLLSDALDTIKVAYKNPEDTTRAAALNDIQALGSEVVPYLWAGVQNEDAEVRIACMKLIGMMNGRTCTKRVIETFYATMPERSAAATWNVPFVDETMKTLVTITGQVFITVEARRMGVQDGVAKYIDWYKANYRSLPRQIGEPDMDPNDKDYESKLAELRALKLSKREWPHIDSLPADFVAGPNKNSPEKGPAPIIQEAERLADKQFGDSIPTVSEDKALKRPDDVPFAPPDPIALKRPVDRRVEDVPTAPQNQRRDPPVEIPSQDSTLAKDPLQRPQDAVRARQNQQ